MTYTPQAMQRLLALVLLFSWCGSEAVAQSTFNVIVGVDSNALDSNYYALIMTPSGPASPSATSGSPAWTFLNFYPPAITINQGDTIAFKFDKSSRRLGVVYSKTTPVSLRNTAFVLASEATATSPALATNFINQSTISSGWMTPSERLAATSSLDWSVTFNLVGSYSFYELSAGSSTMNCTITVQSSASARPLTPAAVDTAAATSIAAHQQMSADTEATKKWSTSASTQGVPGTAHTAPVPKSTSANDGVRIWTVTVGDHASLSSVNGVYQRFVPNALTINMGDIVQWSTSTSASTAALGAANVNQHFIVLNGSTTDGVIDFPSTSTVHPASNPQGFFADAKSGSGLLSTYTSGYTPARSGTTWYYGSGVMSSGLMTATGSTTTTRLFSLQFALPGTYPYWSVTNTGEIGMTGVIVVTKNCPAVKTAAVTGLIKEYPTLSGMNNNPRWCVLGMNGFRQTRLVPFSSYEKVGGVYSPTSTTMRSLTVTGLPLPTARNISNTMLAKEQHLNHRAVSDMHSQVAMFLTFDVSALGDRGTISVPQPVPACDPFFDVACTGTATLPFTRFLPIVGSGTNQQTNPTLYANAGTPYLDLSSIYGMSDQTAPASGTIYTNPITANTIRTFVGGELCLDCSYAAPQIVPGNVGPWQPAGDSRTNKSPSVYSIHMIWKKEHNRLAKELAGKNPSWSDEQLYQEARRFVTAFWQKIISREYLATEVGQPLPAYKGYNSSVDPSTTLEFSAAAGRYGHAMITPQIWRRTMNSEQVLQGDIPWSACLFRTDAVTLSGNPGIEPVIYGMLAQRQGAVGPRMTDAVRNQNIFGARPSKAPSSDLSVTNIARGKDLGIPTYNEMRRQLGLAARTSFDQISSSPDVVSDLQSLYANDIESLDLFIGGISEDPRLGGNLGETFGAIALEQTRRWRDGDRFWYENTDYFTQDEIDTVYATTWSNILARNTGLANDTAHAQYIPKNAFFTLESNLDYRARTALPLALSLDPRYQNSVRLHPLYVLSWSVTADAYLDIELRVANAGWVGIGFEPQLATMKDADIVICRFLSSSLAETGTRRTNAAGEDFECVDSYAEDVGIPTPDVKLGGMDDLLDVDAFHDTDYSTSASGTAVQVFRFRKPVASSDVGIGVDKAVKSGTTTLMYAFHPDSQAAVYHGPSRARTTINWYSVALSSVTLSKDSETLRLAIIIIVAILMLVPTLILIAVCFNYDHPRIRAATLLFCILIPVGTILAFLGVIIAMLEKTTETCMAFYWLTGTAFVLVFGSIFFKTYRIMRIFNVNNLGTTRKTGKLQLVKITTTTLALYTFALACGMWLILGLWSGLDPMTPQYVLASGSSTSANETCASSSDGYLLAWILLPVIVLLYGSYMSYAVRGVENAIFNESATLAQAIYVTTVITAIGLAFGFGLRKFSNTTPLIQAVAILASFMFTLISQFADKFSAIHDQNQSKLQTVAHGSIVGDDCNKVAPGDEREVNATGASENPLTNASTKQLHSNQLTSPASRRQSAQSQQKGGYGSRGTSMNKQPEGSKVSVHVENGGDVIHPQSTPLQQSRRGSHNLNVPPALAALANSVILPSPRVTSATSIEEVVPPGCAQDAWTEKQQSSEGATTITVALKSTPTSQGGESPQ